MNFISEFRKEKGMTQKQFAEKTGISVSAISKAENGRINLNNACAICNAFPDELHIKNLSIQRIGALANESRAINENEDEKEFCECNGNMSITSIIKGHKFCESCGKFKAK